MGRDRQDTSVERVKQRIGREGWAANIFARQKESTFWENEESCYVPMSSSTGWQLAVLADLGVSSEDRSVANADEHFFDVRNLERRGFSRRPKYQEPVA